MNMLLLILFFKNFWFWIKFKKNYLEFLIELFSEFKTKNK